MSEITEQHIMLSMKLNRNEINIDKDLLAAISDNIREMPTILSRIWVGVLFL